MDNAIKNRYDFVLLFDVKDGNPNGDPDAGNLPRLDPETGHGLVTDVCLKRKVRNFVLLDRGDVPRYDIYVKEKAVLGRAHTEVFKELGINLGEEGHMEVPVGIQAELEESGLPDGISVEVNEDRAEMVLGFDLDRDSVKEWLKGSEASREVKTFINNALKAAKSRKPKADEVEQGRDKMCEKFYDVRTFGAVMSLKSAPNCGQVRGPVQLTFARSINPVVALEYSITRMAVATEREAEKQAGDNRTMGRKYTVPYGLYRAHGFISAPLAEQTGFSDDDLTLFWRALINMFEHDHSAARGQMSTRKLIVFEHASRLGNAPSQSLLDQVKVKVTGNPARDFTDFEVVVPVQNQMPEGVTVKVMV